MEKYIIYIVLAVIVALIGYFISTTNFFKKQKQVIEHSKSNIEIALTNRYDALVKLNKAVNGYTGHEQSVLTNTVKIRKGMTTKELNEASEQMDEAYEKLSVLVENYPDLKASTNFLQLQDSIMELENIIQATRRIFNKAVNEYNDKVVSIPSNIVAKIIHATEEAYFEAEAHKLQDVDLKF